MRKTGFRTLFLALAIASLCWAGAPAQASKLSDAVNAGNLAEVKALIAAGADVNKGDMFGKPLHAAVARGEIDIVTALLDAGANIEAKGLNGARPLHLAALANRVEIAKLLIARGANLESRDNNGLTPLLVAVPNGKLEVTKVLLDAGADVNARGHRFRYNAIADAVYGCKIPIVKLLLSRGMDINAPVNDKGETLLFLVAPELHEEPATLDQRLAMITFLLANGLDPNVRNSAGKTAYDLSSDPKVRALLAEHGAQQ